MSSCLVAAEYTHVDLPCSEWVTLNTNIGKHTTTAKNNLLEHLAAACLFDNKMQPTFSYSLVVLCHCFQYDLLQNLRPYR